MTNNIANFKFFKYDTPPHDPRLLEEYIKKKCLPKCEVIKPINTDTNTELMDLVLRAHTFPISLIKKIKNLLQLDTTKIDAQNEKGLTALMLASRHSNGKSNLPVVKLLIDCGANVNIKDSRGYTAIMYAVQYSNTTSNLATVKLLIDNGADLEYKALDYYSVLTLASQYSNTTSNLSTVKLLIDSGVAINTCGAYRHTALAYAVMYSNTTSNLETVNFLLQNGANVNNHSKHGQTALMLASMYSTTKSNLDTVQLLIKSGANVDAVDNIGNTALHYAAEKLYTSSSFETIKLLMDNNANVTIKNNANWTILSTVCNRTIKSCDKDTLIALIIKSKNIINEQNNTCFKTAYDYYIQHNNKLLDENEIEYLTTSIHLFETIVSCSNDLNALETILVKNSDHLCDTSDSGETLLMYISRKHKQQLSDNAFELIVSQCNSLNAHKPSQINSRNMGKTFVNFLCNHDNSVLLNVCDDQNNCYNNRVDILVRNGVDVNLSNTYMTTPLMLACKNLSLHQVKILVGAGANINSTRFDGVTALMIACSRCRIDIVEFLLANGADPNIVSVSGNNALYFCGTYSKHRNRYADHRTTKAANATEDLSLVAKLLIRHGVEINKKDHNGRSILVRLCRYPNIKSNRTIIKILIDAGSDVNYALINLIRNGDMISNNSNKKLLMRLILASQHIIHVKDYHNLTAYQLYLKKQYTMLNKDELKILAGNAYRASRTKNAAK